MDNEVVAGDESIQLHTSYQFAGDAAGAGFGAGWMGRIQPRLEAPLFIFWICRLPSAYPPNSRDRRQIVQIPLTIFMGTI